MRRLFGSIIVLLALSLLVSACGSKLRGWDIIQLGPRISGVTAPTSANHAGENFTFAVQTTGPTVVAWDWDFAGGALPATATTATPTVVLVNPSTTTDATYNGSVTVTDADNRSDTIDFTYVVGMTLNQDPEFVGLPASITGNFSFGVTDADGDPVTITLALTSGSGVTINPTTINATSPYGTYDITVSNDGVDPVDIVIGITLNDGVNDDVVGSVSGTIPGIDLDPNGIYVIAPASVNVGDDFTVTVYASSLEFPLAYLSSVVLDYGGDEATRPNYADWLLTVNPDSWNLGAAGGDAWAKDGTLWDAYTSSLLAIGARLFSWDDINTNTPWANISVNVSGLGAPPNGAPAGASGPLFNIAFHANAAGSVNFSFVDADTYYAEPDNTEHPFVNYVGATVVIN